MDYFNARVVASQQAGASYTLLTLEGCEGLAGARPGQFVMLRGDWGRDPLLPRAYSILGVEGARARFLIKRLGRGSNLLGRVAPGDALSVLGPLGNGFPPAEPGTTDLLVAGGCGLPPLHLAALAAAGRGEAGAAVLLLGARNRDELARPLHEELHRAGVTLELATEDGSAGVKGLVTDLLRRRLSGREGAVRVLACGPEAMLRAVRQVAREQGVPCLLSLEAGMACGVGVCLGCAVQGRERPYLHVCSDGPVFDAEEVWP